MRFSYLENDPMRSITGPHLRDILQGASVALILKIIGAGVSFLFNVILARKLGAEGTGVFYLALTVMTLTATVARFGVDNVLLRRVAANMSQGKMGDVRGVYRFGMLLAVPSSLLVTIVGWMLAPWLSNDLFAKPELVGPLRWMMLASLPFNLLLLHAELLRALKVIGQSQVIQGVASPLLALIAVWYLAAPWGVVGASAAYLFGALVTATAGLWLWRRGTREVSGSHPVYPHAGIFLRNCSDLFFGTFLANVFMRWAPFALLGIWADSHDVGIYGIATRVALLVGLMLASVNTIVAPKFASLYASGDLEALGAIARTSVRYLRWLGAPVTLSVILGQDYIMGAFGDEFVPGGTALAILALGQYIGLACGSVGYLLIMTGHDRQYRRCSAISSLLLTAVALLTIPTFGVVGAALSYAVATAALNIQAAWYVHRLLGISVIHRPRLRYHGP